MLMSDPNARRSKRFSDATWLLLMGHCAGGGCRLAAQTERREKERKRKKRKE